MTIQLTIDANYVFRKWSTWLSLLSAASTAGMLAYSQLPPDIQTIFPHWLLASMGVAAVVSAMAVPVATSIQQKSIPTLPAPSSEEMP